MRKKGFTLIELLVVIAIIAMLLAILMPALNKVKRLAQRLVCGTSVKGLGTAMMVYAQDFEDEYPMQGGSGEHAWAWDGKTQEWWNPDLSWSTTTGTITVAASLYLLVRNADVDPKSFVCRSGDEKTFPGVSGTANLDLVELWDFGGQEVDTTLPGGKTVVFDQGDLGDNVPRNFVSYAFQLPYAVEGWRARPASATASASTAILADKNPWCDPKLNPGTGTFDQKKRDYMMLVDFLGAGTIDWTDPDEELRNSSTAWQIQIANSQPHGREGQNVLYGDGHASFEKRPDISYQHDNIYTMYDNTEGPPSYNEWDRRTGSIPVGGAPGPDPIPTKSAKSRTDEDSLLVNDDSRYPQNHNW